MTLPTNMIDIREYRVWFVDGTLCAHTVVKRADGDRWFVETHPFDNSEAGVLEEYAFGERAAYEHASKRAQEYMQEAIAADDEQYPDEDENQQSYHIQVCDCQENRDITADIDY